MSGIDFNFLDFQQGNYMSNYHLQQLVCNAIDNKDASLKDKTATEDSLEGFNFWNEEFPASNYDDIFANTVDLTGQSSQAPVEASSSNSGNLDTALPAPTSTQPPADPALPNGVNVVGPWPIVPVSRATSPAANESNGPALDALPPSNAAQPTPEITHWCLENGVDPAHFMALIGASSALQVPATNEPVGLGLPNTETNNTQGSTSNTFVNTTATHVPQGSAQVPQLRRPQSVLDPELANSGANNSAMGAFMNQADYYAPNANANGTPSMGMAADGGFTAPPPATSRSSAATATAQRRTERRQAVRAAQAPLQSPPPSQRRRVPQSVQAPQQAQLIQTPQLDAQYLLLAQQMLMNGANMSVPQLAGANGPQVPPTPAMVMNGHVQNSSVTQPTAFFLLPPSMAIPAGNQSLGQYPNVVTTNGTPQLATQPSLQAPFLPAVTPTQVPNTVNPAALSAPSTSVNPRHSNADDSTATILEHYARISFEFEGEKKKSEMLQAQIKQLQDQENALNSWSTAVPTPSPPAASQPPQQLTQFQSTSSFANVEPTYDFDQPSADLPAFPDFDLPSNTLSDFPTNFAQDFGTMPPLPYLAAPFEDQWQQAIDFGNVPQLTLDLSQQQQQDFVTQAQTFHPPINGRHQLSNCGPGEHHLGTLHRQQVEQVQQHGSLPHESHNFTNGNHYHQSSGGATSSSSLSSKRKRDEIERQDNDEREAGGVPSPPKRQRTPKKSADKGKGREVAAVTGDESTRSTTRKRSRGTSKPHVPKPGETQTPPLTAEEAMEYLRRGRFCEIEGCLHPIQPAKGAYWKHYSTCHAPKTLLNGEVVLCLCGRAVRIENIKAHLDNSVHAWDKELKCCGCSRILAADETMNPSEHFKRNAKCREGSKMFIGIEPAVKEVLGEWKPRAGVSQKELEKDKDDYEHTREMLQVKNDLSQRRQDWELKSCGNLIERRCVD
ncbi:hypothetical protein MD484_g3141, partial [Candolleomyces efflorescens]